MKLEMISSRCQLRLLYYYYAEQVFRNVPVQQDGADENLTKFLAGHP
jgi:hypothetical protein